MKQSASWQWEIGCRQQNRNALVAGLDEVGRGAWAGPLVAVAYVFHTIPVEIELFDSKVLPEKERQKIASQLIRLGHSGLGEVSAHEIDSLGLQTAQYLAYERALQALPIWPDFVLLDGRPWKTCPIPHTAIIGGDSLVASISAAAVLAKVYRDTVMKTAIHVRYPNYRFDLHVGYGTKAHRAAIGTYGIVEVHRKSYKPLQPFI